MIQARLLSEKAELTNKLLAAKDVAIDSSGDEMDLSSARLIAGVESQLSKMDAGKLAKIDAALNKIKSGTFGVCQECEEDIGEKRLDFNPSFSECVVCVEAKERFQKTHRPR